MSLFPYPYALNLRARAMAGSVPDQVNDPIRATFRAGSLYRGIGGTLSADTAALVIGGVYTFIAPTILGPPTYQKEELPREGIDAKRTRRPLTIGFRPRLHVEWMQPTTEVLGIVGYSLTNLRNVIGYLTTVGDYLELALDGWLANPNYRWVNLASDAYEYRNIEGKTLGVSLALDFEGAQLISEPPDASALLWGTAI